MSFGSRCCDSLGFFSHIDPKKKKLSVCCFINVVLSNKTSSVDTEVLSTFHKLDPLFFLKRSENFRSPLCFFYLMSSKMTVDKTKLRGVEPQGHTHSTFVSKLSHDTLKRINFIKDEKHEIKLPKQICFWRCLKVKNFPRHDPKIISLSKTYKSYPRTCR